jgi:hypothetical protein
MPNSNPEMESPFDAGEPITTPEQEAADILEGATEKNTVRPDVMSAVSEFADRDKQELFTKDTEDTKKWTALEQNLNTQYEAVIGRLMGGARDTLDPISQKVYDAHMRNKDENIKLTIKSLKDKNVPVERATELAAKELADRLFGQP